MGDIMENPVFRSLATSPWNYSSEFSDPYEPELPQRTSREIIAATNGKERKLIEVMEKMAERYDFIKGHTDIFGRRSFVVKDPNFKLFYPRFESDANGNNIICVNYISQDEFPRLFIYMVFKMGISKPETKMGPEGFVKYIEDVARRINEGKH